MEGRAWSPGSWLVASDSCAPSLLLLLIPSPADFFRNVERTISTGDSTCFAAFLGVCFVRLATVSIRYSRLDCSRQSTGEGRDSDSRRAQPDRKRSWPN